MHPGFRGVTRRQDQDRKRRIAAANFTTKVQAVAVRKAEVEKEEIARSKQRNSGGRDVACDFDRKTGILQGQGELCRDTLVIFDEQ